MVKGKVKGGQASFSKEGRERGAVVSELTWQEREVIQGAKWAGVVGVAASAMVRVAHAEYLFELKSFCKSILKQRPL